MTRPSALGFARRKLFEGRFGRAEKLHLIVMEGISECMAPGVLGFSLLSLVWLVMAVGHRRLAQQLPL